ncbi:MAG: beta-propeller domain-containing protein, partial [Coriobacteriales bacterium]|nr:beta-propeller domain-containing protein [Coriobacteriales bacterium]
MSNDIFKDMREQMTPSPEVMARLQIALDTEPATKGEMVDRDTTVAIGVGGAAHATETVETAEAISAAEAMGAAGVVGTTEVAESAGKTEAAGATIKPSAAARRRRPFAMYLSAAAAFFLVAVTAGLLIADRSSPGDVDSLVNSSTRGQTVAVVDAGPVRAPADYEELYSILDEAGVGGGRYGVVPFGAQTDAEAFEGVFSMDDAAGTATGAAANAASGTATDAVTDSAPVPEIAPQAESLAAPSTSNEASSVVSPASEGAGTEDYSGTNVQVEGIDEGDIIKTDGRYIYALSWSQGELVVFEAAGSETVELSRVTISEASLTLYRYPEEMYLSGSTLAIVENRFNGNAASSAWSEGNPEETWLTLYDVSDPSHPTLTTEFAQSGNYRTSRLYGDRLYLIGSYYLNYAVERGEPGTYVPQLGKGGSYELMAASDVRIMPSVQQPNYTVVTSYDLAAQERIDQKAVLGEASTVYMSYDNLYLGSSIYAVEESEPYQESVYTVVDYTEKQTTQLVRIGVNEGLLDVAAQCTFDGRLLNQFSLDEYEGNLRLAVTHESYSYRVLKDESHDIESYQQGENGSTSAVYVFDSSLAIIGSIEGLAADERIYSVRFTGPVGYMVTYRQMDPLFALDLSDPTAPEVTSELKIPGFSTYLHPFGEGRLLGLGYDADGSVTRGMKLSMFDISDPFSVSELFAESVDTYDSAALYDHKAVLVDVERNIIGFPGRGTSYDGLQTYFV